MPRFPQSFKPLTFAMAKGLAALAHAQAANPPALPTAEQTDTVNLGRRWRPVSARSRLQSAPSKHLPGTSLFRYVSRLFSGFLCFTGSVNRAKVSASAGGAIDN